MPVETVFEVVLNWSDTTESGFLYEDPMPDEFFEGELLAQVLLSLFVPFKDARSAPPEDAEETS